MKFIKKFNSILLILILLICTFFVEPNSADAKTLRDLKEEYEKTKQEFNNNQEQEKLTQEEIKKINNNIVLIQQNIEKGQQEIIVLNNEIADLEEKMDIKDKEIKRILNFLQVSEGENVYLEYAFGARNFTDFIYRMAVTEQLSKYNDSLIKEYNGMIETNKKKQEDIRTKEKQMQQQQADMKVQISKLQGNLSNLYEDYIDLSSSLEIQETIISMYEKDYKCKLDEDLDECARNALPSDTAFWRPTTFGSITSEYGMRLHPTQNVWKLHAGVDIGVPSWTPVYSIAAGTVAALTIRASCGGNMIFVIHRVKGQYYTSVYMHLSSINVNVGDVVTKDTIIGYSGGDPAITYWDTCTTGGHLHLTALYGRVGTDYYAFDNGYYASLIDPRQIINFPARWVQYNNRTSRY